MVEKPDDWEQHWREYSESAQNNPAQNYRRELILSLLRKASNPMRVLDVGSGQGDFARDLLNCFPRAEIRGLELSKTGVELAKKKVPKVLFQQRDLLKNQEVPIEQKNWATHAICSEVLEHLQSPELLLNNVSDYLAPGCKLIITVPGGPMSAFDKHIGHRQHFSGQELFRLLDQNGFYTVDIFQAGFPFFNLYKVLTILRGSRLIRDVSSTESNLSFTAEMLMRLFRILFKLNLKNTPFGWQLVAIAKKK